MSVQMSMMSRYLIELRIGRVNGLMDLLDKNPHLVNTKIRSSLVTDESFLELAVRFDQYNAVLLLQNRGAVETPNTAPNLLYYAVLNNREKLIEQFSNGGWDPWFVSPQIGQSAIGAAVNSSNLFAFNTWSKNKIDFKKLDECNNNLLHNVVGHFNFASSSAAQKIASLLIQKGVSWEQTNKSGCSPCDVCTSPKLQKKLTTEWQSLIANQCKENIIANLNKNMADKPTKKRKM